ncbi:Bug family tripartite tricarboxylate transporter substrate binding protein [Bradyrhizobium sp.]|jgi:tripartite-type tricarboxylate transporter receptor subunit TctC|uniref:Bug family tripartite tricarboxylate transporter substrate binding protein n=1 Tax=Bradyrhizobium sp. TaxID=376 RepID=UPI003D0B89BC
MKYLHVVAALGAVLFVSAPVMADTYPSRPVTVVVPYPAGGSVDGVARIIAQRLTEALGQGFIVENRAGGVGGIVGASYVARAAADGYTLMLTASIHVVTPYLRKTMPYDVVADFTPITLVASGPLLVSTTPTVPANTLAEFFDLVRKDPGKYTFATSSFGSAGHLAIELLKRDAGVETLVVAYKGGGPALNDLMSGTVQLIADPMLSSLPLAKAGNIKALAVTSTKRVAIAPEIPTVAESGMKGFDFASWYGLWAPKGLPADLVTKIQTEVTKIVQRPDVKEQFALLGFEPIGSTPDYFAKYIKDEMAKYQEIVRDANIKAE